MKPKHDKRTISLIRKLVSQYKKRKLTDIDIEYLNKLRKGEIDAN